MALGKAHALANQLGLLVSKLLRPLDPSVAQMANRLQLPRSSLPVSLIGMSLWLAKVVTLSTVPAVPRDRGSLGASKGRPVCWRLVSGPYRLTVPLVRPWHPNT
mmetsp:Transcript_39342/g.111485  ORF Transcript_39342/g.111485 Transcript_39342/m.111485 type:complete len:104 (-) Transcript_39342:577-888(-)